MTIYFDQTDRDGDRVRLAAGTPGPGTPMISVVPKAGGAHSVFLDFDDVEKLHYATGRMPSDNERTISTPPELVQAGPSAGYVRRAAALALAKETLGVGMIPVANLLELANWLLGDDQQNPDPIIVNVSGDINPDQAAEQIRKLQHQLGRRAAGSERVS